MSKNCKLYVSNLDPSIDETTLFYTFKGMKKENRRIIGTKIGSLGEEKKYGIVEFEHEEDALDAYLNLKHNDLNNFEKCMNVNFYDPKLHKELDPNANLYIRMLPPKVNENKIQVAITSYLQETLGRKNVIELMPYSIKVGMSANNKRLNYGYIQFIDMKFAKIILDNSEEVAKRLDPGGHTQFLVYHKENKILYAQLEKSNDIKTKEAFNSFLNSLLSNFRNVKIHCHENAKERMLSAFVELDSEEKANKILKGEDLMKEATANEMESGITIITSGDTSVKFTKTDHKNSNSLLMMDLRPNIDMNKLRIVLQDIFPKSVKLITMKGQKEGRNSAIVECNDKLQARMILMECKTEKKFTELFNNPNRILISYHKEKPKILKPVREKGVYDHGQQHNYNPQFYSGLSQQQPNQGFGQNFAMPAGVQQRQNQMNQMPVNQHQVQMMSTHPPQQVNYMNQQFINSPYVYQPPMVSNYPSQQMNPQRQQMVGQNYGQANQMRPNKIQNTRPGNQIKPKFNPYNNNNQRPRDKMPINNHLMQNGSNAGGIPQPKSLPINTPNQNFNSGHPNARQYPVHAAPDAGIAKLNTIRNNINDLKDPNNLDEKTKNELRNVLGEQLFKLVPTIMSINDPQQKIAAKITGMLIDFDVFDVSDILNMIDNIEELKDRVKEAEELISNSADNN